MLAWTHKAEDAIETQQGTKVGLSRTNDPVTTSCSDTFVARHLTNLKHRRWNFCSAQVLWRMEDGLTAHSGACRTTLATRCVVGVQTAPLYVSIPLPRRRLTHGKIDIRANKLRIESGSIRNQSMRIEFTRIDRETNGQERRVNTSAYFPSIGKGPQPSRRSTHPCGPIDARAETEAYSCGCCRWRGPPGGRRASPTFPPIGQRIARSRKRMFSREKICVPVG